MPSGPALFQEGPRVNPQAGSQGGHSCPAVFTELLACWHSSGLGSSGTGSPHPVPPPHLLPRWLTVIEGWLHRPVLWGLSSARPWVWSPQGRSETGSESGWFPWRWRKQCGSGERPGHWRIGIIPWECGGRVPCEPGTQGSEGAEHGDPKAEETGSMKILSPVGSLVPTQWGS